MYNEIRANAGKQRDQLCKDQGVIWAFSKERLVEQVDKTKAPYVSIGAGGYLPKANVDQFLNGMEAIELAEKQAIQAAKCEQEQTILYELNNHECYVSNDITDAMPRLKSLGFTVKQVKKVFMQHQFTGGTR